MEVDIADFAFELVKLKKDVFINIILSKSVSNNIFLSKSLVNYINHNVDDENGDIFTEACTVNLSDGMKSIQLKYEIENRRKNVKQQLALTNIDNVNAEDREKWTDVVRRRSKTGKKETNKVVYGTNNQEEVAVKKRAWLFVSK
ncbi:hypothetical protein HHI36_022988 [Cryptolaemus montrouzieri]|uniref:Uncharacterized protein n=1 Tax=Cryptolaemus montrouzieri TaxID=559131 RepID=A0ABD2PFA1_9CUCU